MKLSTIMCMLGHDWIDLIKLDIDGTEINVIEDLQKSGNIPTSQILIDFNDNHDITVRDEIYIFLASNGFIARYTGQPQMNEVTFVRSSPVPLSFNQTTFKKLKKRDIENSKKPVKTKLITTPTTPVKTKKVSPVKPDTNKKHKETKNNINTKKSKQKKVKNNK